MNGHLVANMLAALSVPTFLRSLASLPPSNDGSVGGSVTEIALSCLDTQ
jgi:hypothetical protein